MPEASGPAGVKRLAAMAHASFPDLHFTIEDMVAEGDKVVYRYSLRGTHQNDFMGIAATGRQVNVTGIHIYRVDDGKLQEEWENWDMLGLMRQLGVLPQPGQGKK
jgi:steroid delta-isomerase-like uncharacterized protein